VALLLTTSQNLERVKLKQPSTAGKNSQYQPSRAPKGEAMDWESTTTTRLAAAQKQELRTTQKQRAAWVSQKELGRRRELGLCLRCGAKGHRIPECPLARALNPAHSTTVASAVSSPKPRIEEVEDSSDECTDSGKGELSP